jgi:phosphoribosylanthranilate isomerase
VDEAAAATHPFAVDVASGVEREPGLKDHALMASFLERAQVVAA